MPNLNKPTVLWLAQLASCLALLALLPLAAIVALFALLALLVWTLLSPLAPALRWLWRAARNSARRLRQALGLSCLCALSGCGTVPSAAETCPRVPAAFLLPPAQPTLLAPQAPALGLKTPGPTTAPTPAAAPLTAPDTPR